MIQESYDLIVIGGGITGAGVFHLAAQNGLRVLLVDQGDFSSGTSSKSSKLVHGGLRYLKQGRIGLTRQSVRERQMLLHHWPDLVQPLSFAMPVIPKRTSPGWMIGAGLALYDGLAGTNNHRRLGQAETHQWATAMPGLTSRCVYQFEDALVDDCRLTLRLIFEALDRFPDQVVAMNHTKVASVERTSRGFSCRLVRSSSETPIDLETATVVLASGAANDQWQCLFDEKGVDDKATHIRPLRGSHLMFPAWTLPLTQAVVMAHPENHRPLFLIPWGGALMFGTTDLDHTQGAQEDVRMASEEVSYLMRALEDAFPDGRFRREQALSTFSGVRPVLEKPSQKKNQPPSALSREHGISSCRGVVAVTGGKLTTFRVMAAEVLRVIRGVHPQLFKGPWQESLLGKSTGFSQGPGLPGEVQCQAFHTLSSQSERRFMERFGSNYASWQTLGPLEKSLLYSAAFEKVQHLDDLLMRRTRLGLVAPSGGLEFLFPIKQNLMQILSWGDSRWDEECLRFGSRLERYYRLPGEPEDGERS